MTTVKVNGIPCTLAGGVRETSHTTGTGNYAMNGAATIDGITYRTFAGAIGNGNRTVYRAQLGSEFEHGIGTVTAPSTLSRDVILSSSNGGNAVNWGTTDPKHIWCDAAAAVFHSMQDQIDTNVTNIATNATDIAALETLTAQITKDGSNQYRIDPGANDRLAIMITNATDAIVAALRITSGGDGRVQVEDADSNIQAVMVGSGGGRFFVGGDESTGNEIKPYFTASGTVVYTGSGVVSAAHGLGAVPTHFAWFLRCDVSEGNYSVNDEVEISGWQTQADVNDVISYWKNATEIGVAGNNIRIGNKTTSADFVPSSTNWTWKWYATVLT